MLTFRAIACLLAMLMGVYPVAAQTQLFSGAPLPASLFLPAANNVSANWQNAGLQTIGGIPTRSTQCGSTLSPSGLIPPQANDDAALLTAAIAACTAGDVILMATGTFNYAQSELPIVVNKGITIRGSGSPASGNCDASLALNTPCWGTVLQTYDGPQPTYRSNAQCGVTISSTSNCPNGSGFFLVGPEGLFNYGMGGACGWPATTVNPTTMGCGTTLTADAAQGATSVTVTSTTNFSVGQYVLIDEDPQLVSTVNPVPGQVNIQASMEFLDVGPTPAVGRIANPDAGNCTYSFCTNRVTEELHKITGIVGNVISFDSPLTTGFRQSGSHDGRLYWPATQGGTPISFLTQAGIENLTLTRVNGGGINFQFCALCWAKNVEINYWTAGTVNFTGTIRSQVTGSYLHNCIDCQNNGAEYPIGISSASTENLIDNNIIQFGGKCMVGRAAPGNVIAYNYMDKTMYEVSVIGDWFVDMCANTSHYAGTHQNLLESNWANNCDGDQTHGNNVYQIFFRNQCTGLRSTFVDPSNGLTVNDCNGIGFSPSTTGGLAISSGTYTTGTGAIVLTMSNSPGYTTGTKVTIQGLTGTGANLFSLTGTYSSTVSGTTVTLAGPTGQGTITITGGVAIGNLPTSPAPLRAAGPMSFGYQFGYIGNIMGQSGMQSCSGGSFIYDGTTGTSAANRAIWISGWTDAGFNNKLDANLKVALGNNGYIFRNGNYDFVNTSVVDNAAGYSQSFPNSLYLPSSGASPPAYFSGGAACTYAYPWIVPASGTVHTASGAGACTTYSGLPAKARMDAGTPFVQP